MAGCSRTAHVPHQHVHHLPRHTSSHLITPILNKSMTLRSMKMRLHPHGSQSHSFDDNPRGCEVFRGEGRTMAILKIMGRG